MIPAIFKEVKPSKQLLLFFFFWVLCFVFASVVSLFLVNELFQLPKAAPGLAQHLVDQYKIVQLVTSLIIFVMPPLVILRLFEEDIVRWLGLKRIVRLNAFVLVVVLLFTSLPLLNLVISWNASLHLPDALQGLETFIRKMEDDAEQLTVMFLKAESLSGLVINLLLIAVVPAVGEELLFRGVFQRLFYKIKNNPHIAIWSAACLFSLMHFQFYGFFPRLLLGALFGYLFHWSGTLWIPIFAHFVNNAAAVMLSYYAEGKGGLQEQLDELGTTEQTWYYLIPSVLLFAAGVWLFRKEVMEREGEKVNAV